ncbi:MULTISPECIES: hypothetical protein [Pseudomonas]|uniref:Uncharacterized protein n=1 Tax=Pseudomonas gingeri TaxID=117681 RepID=A0A7Y8BW09_9PSED|nr:MULTISPECIES: hypothetical protein [Pseudomonas]NWB89327.1 hypothetical protein [Pseudomonas gingeri]
MNSVTLASFRADGTVLLLSDLLAVIPDNDWVWSVLEFQGVGCAPDGLSMDEYEAFLLSQERGDIMTWGQLLEFSQSMEQTFNCLVVAVNTVAEIIKPSGFEIVPETYVLAIEAFDSTCWTLWSDRPEITQALGLVQGLSVAGGTSGNIS